MMHSRYFMGWNGCLGEGLFGGIWGWLIGIGLILLTAALIYLLVRRGKSKSANSSAIEALGIKFAKGEITEGEYNNRKSVLLGKQVKS